MNHHNIKILPEHYNNVKAGTKTFEIRDNDRAYQKGDKVTLYFWEKDTLSGNIKYCTDSAHPRLTFLVGDVYPIDSTRVVFSLLKGRHR